eukprot:TRINITY_DN16482_c0_g1_i1.p1 TRINITY_DN16482_c0_g1~~TRINITY_DN16482_c0_g1_i1.p1  ORF type:complete len:219 (+),score=41.14 TRINITY_DN16482_c0_g1_i1:88-744(+)
MNSSKNNNNNSESFLSSTKSKVIGLSLVALGSVFFLFRKVTVTNEFKRNILLLKGDGNNAKKSFLWFNDIENYLSCKSRKEGQGHYNYDLLEKTNTSHTFKLYDVIPIFGRPVTLSTVCKRTHDDITKLDSKEQPYMFEDSWVTLGMKCFVTFRFTTGKYPKDIQVTCNQKFENGFWWLSKIMILGGKKEIPKRIESLQKKLETSDDFLNYKIQESKE